MQLNEGRAFPVQTKTLAQAPMPAGEQRVLAFYRALPPGEPLPSQKDIAAALQISAFSVSNFETGLRAKGLIPYRRQRRPECKLLVDGVGGKSILDTTDDLSRPKNMSRDPRQRPAMRLCLGPTCMGKREFMSSHAGDRICKNCSNSPVFGGAP